MSKIISIHQPNFLPWLGFFDKWDRADAFIILDKVQLIRRSYGTRVQILTPQGPKMISVPVRHIGTQNLPIDEAELDLESRLFEKISRTLIHNYANYPFWNEIGPRIIDVLNNQPPKLLEFNLKLINILGEALGLSFDKLHFQSELDFCGKKSTLMSSLTRAVNGTIYLSGGHRPSILSSDKIKTGTAADYNDTKVFNSYGVKLSYQNFVHPRYPQNGNDFVPGLSALDALVRLGPEVMQYVRSAQGR